MKQKSVSIGIIILNLVFSFFIFYFISNFIWLFCCLNYSNSIYLPDNYEIMRIKIYGSSDFSTNETVSANISILNTDEVECAVIERSWSGTSIAIDCFSFNNKFFFVLSYFCDFVYTGKSFTASLFSNKDIYTIFINYSLRMNWFQTFLINRILIIYQTLFNVLVKAV